MRFKTGSHTRPNGDTACARYDLRSWVGDLSVGYAIPAGGNGR